MRKSSSFIDQKENPGQRRTPKATQPAKAVGLAGAGGEHHRTHRAVQPLPNGLNNANNLAAQANNGQKVAYKSTNPEDARPGNPRVGTKKSSFIQVTTTQ